MSLTEQQIWIASKIDAKMQKLIRTGKDDMAITVAMADHMTRFKELVDTLRNRGRFPGEGVALRTRA